MKPDKKKPLYRKVNTKTHNVQHGQTKGKAKWDRRTKSNLENESSFRSMHSNRRHGYDYTPLYKFLLSRVGRNWDDVYSEAKARLDQDDPIFWMVALHEADKRDIIRSSESTYYSGLFVNEDNILAIVDPSISHETLEPFCPCCTHTFNGQPFEKHHPYSKHYVAPEEDADPKT